MIKLAPNGNAFLHALASGVGWTKSAHLFGALTKMMRTLANEFSELANSTGKFNRFLVASGRCKEQPGLALSRTAELLPQSVHLLCLGNRGSRRGPFQPLTKRFNPKHFANLHGKDTKHCQLLLCANRGDLPKQPFAKEASSNSPQLV